mmetsp:Transcript_37053/g.105933  ORF Transcript_37053/g.105933 Transcript_37053/m.105933 type:complete len:365 (+) Transcript_37053:2239-3333(+)
MPFPRVLPHVHRHDLSASVYLLVQHHEQVGLLGTPRPHLRQDKPHLWSGQQQQLLECSDPRGRFSLPGNGSATRSVQLLRRHVRGPGEPPQDVPLGTAAEDRAARDQQLEHRRRQDGAGADLRALQHDEEDREGPRREAGDEGRPQGLLPARAHGGAAPGGHRESEDAGAPPPPLRLRVHPRRSRGGQLPVHAQPRLRRDDKSAAGDGRQPAHHEPDLGPRDRLCHLQRLRGCLCLRQDQLSLRGERPHREGHHDLHRPARPLPLRGCVAHNPRNRNHPDHVLLPGPVVPEHLPGRAGLPEGQQGREQGRGREDLPPAHVVGLPGRPASLRHGPLQPAGPHLQPHDGRHHGSVVRRGPDEAAGL